MQASLLRNRVNEIICLILSRPQNEMQINKIETAANIQNFHGIFVVVHVDQNQILRDKQRFARFPRHKPFMIHLHGHCLVQLKMLVHYIGNELGDRGNANFDSSYRWLSSESFSYLNLFKFSIEISQRLREFTNLFAT